MNDSAYVSPDLRSRVLKAIGDLRYAPSQVARNLKRGRTQGGKPPGGGTRGLVPKVPLKTS